MSWRAELVAVGAFARRNLMMASRNVFLIFELIFWPVVGVLGIGLMARFLDLKSFFEHVFADIAVAIDLWRQTVTSAQTRLSAIPSSQKGTE